MRPTSSRILGASKTDSVSSVRAGGRTNTTPLFGKTIFLDVKNRVASAQIEAGLKKLGARVEVFIVDGINLIVTDRRGWTDGGRGVPKEEEECVPPEQQNSLTVCSGSSGSVDASEIGTKKLRLKSRAEEMLERVQRHPSQDSFDPLDVAVKRGVPILSFQKVLHYINKANALIQCKRSRNLLEASSVSPSISNTGRPFIKVDFESGPYQPLFKEILPWPAVIIQGKGSAFGPKPANPANYQRGPRKTSSPLEQQRVKHPNILRVETVSSKICEKSFPPLSLGSIADETLKENLSADTVKYSSRKTIRGDETQSNCEDFLKDACQAVSCFTTNSEYQCLIDRGERKQKSDGGGVIEGYPNVSAALEGDLAVNLNISLTRQKVVRKFVPLKEDSLSEKTNVPNEITQILAYVPRCYSNEAEGFRNPASTCDIYRTKLLQREKGFGSGSSVLKRPHSNDSIYPDGVKKEKSEAKKDPLEDFQAGCTEEVADVKTDQLSSKQEPVHPKPEISVLCGGNESNLHSGQLNTENSTLVDLASEKHPQFGDIFENNIVVTESFHATSNSHSGLEERKTVSLKGLGVPEGRGSASGSDSNATVVRGVVSKESESLFEKPASVLPRSVESVTDLEINSLSEKCMQTSESRQQWPRHFIQQKLPFVDQGGLVKEKKVTTSEDAFKKPSLDMRMLPLSARRKRKGNFMRTLPGFCEICGVHYISLNKHLKDKLHKETFLNHSSLVDLDRLIARSNIDGFFEHLKIPK